MAPVAACEKHVKKVFKFVAGVLNGAFSDEKLSEYEEDIKVLLRHPPHQIRFAHACRALANAIKENQVPQQGMDVLKQLLREYGRDDCDALYEVFNMSEQVTDDAHAQQVFTFVVGVLKGKTHLEIADYEEGIHRWVDCDGDAKFSDACDALAYAISDSHFPEEVLAALRELSSADHCASISEKLNIQLHGCTDASDEECHLDPERPLAQVQLTEEQQCESARRMFKAVSGVLNGALTTAHERFQLCQDDVFAWSNHASLTFLTLCDSLASAIMAGQVPHQGQEVLKGLKHNMQRHSLTPTSKLVIALNLDLEKPDPQRAAQRIFEYVFGSLCDTKPEPPDDKDIATWFIPACGVCGDSSSNVLQNACDALALIIQDGALPSKPLGQLVCAAESFHDHELIGSPLEKALLPHLCPRCKCKPPSGNTCHCKGSGKNRCASCSGTGNFRQPCRACDGTGKGRTRMYCPVCNGDGLKVLGKCRDCQGSGTSLCLRCDVAPEFGQPRPLCEDCFEQVKSAADERQRQRKQQSNKAFEKDDNPPAKGVSIEPCAAGDLTRLQDLWSFRGGSSTQLVAAWKVDNPLLTFKFKQRRESLKKVLGREADILEGFHGTAPANVLSIVDTGFDKGKRGAKVGQVHGSGEYFAKDPTISLGYCSGGQFMLVCRLTLGVPSTYGGNCSAQDGDHVWVPSYGGSGCYVIAEPDQILPQFIVKFTGHGGGTACPRLDQALLNGYSTKAKAKIVPVPATQRPCLMSRPEAVVLWIGFLHAHFGDDDLKKDVHQFMMTHAAQYMEGAKIQIVKGHYKKAHVILQKPIPRSLVHKLNQAPFFEQKSKRTICVEDAHGSPGQKCPRYIAGFCRGHNLRYTHPCFCDHPARATQNARFSLESIDMSTAKGMEICDKFMASAPFHNGNPKIVGIKAIKNPVLSTCHEEYRKYLTTKHMDEPAEQELYHGTNNNILDVLYQHGLQPPSDTNASPSCPVSGGKGLSTTLCDNTCKYCTEKHEWNRCHMYGLGIYLGDMAQKSHRYTSQPKTSKNGKQTYRMIVCSVLGKSFQIEGHLRDGTAMHDVVNVRSLDEEEIERMIEPCRAAPVARNGIGASIAGVDGALWGRVVSEDYECWRLHTGRIAKKCTEGVRWNWHASEECSAENREGTAEKSDLLFVKGLGDRFRRNFSVINSEYIAFHPHQCLPKYEIEYELG